MLNKNIAMITLLSVMLTGCFWNEPKPGNIEFAPSYPQVAKAVVPGHSTGSIYRDATTIALFEDTTARRVGDIITIRLTEKTSAKKSAKTKTSRTTAIDVPNPTLFGAGPKFNESQNTLATKLDNTGTFDGKGDSSQSNDLTGTISVTVSQVLGNGNLVIRGEKWVQINRGKEFIRLTGIVRQADIDENNSVDSIKIANARISYSGTGQVAESNVAGWFGRFFMGALGGLFPW